MPSRSSSEYHLHGRALSDLVSGGDWLGTIGFVFLGRALHESERVLLSACLIACVDHGEAPPSARVTTIIAEAGKPLAECVAGGLLTMGVRHANAGSACAAWLRTQLQARASASRAVKAYVKTGARLPGFGHGRYARDPRAIQLLKIAETQLTKHRHIDFARSCADEITKQKGKALYLNIDGALGAIVADLGWRSEMADAIFIIARTVGLCMRATTSPPAPLLAKERGA